MKGKIDAGIIASGKCYCYSLAGDVRGRAEIDPAEAAIVRRIYAEFLEGRAPPEIAERLNAERVPGPAVASGKTRRSMAGRSAARAFYAIRSISVV